MQQRLGARHDFNECAKRRHGLDDTFVCLADDRFRGDRHDHLTRPLHGLATDGRNGDSTIIVHRQLRSSLFLNTADVLALRPNQLANFVDRNLHGHNARCVLRKIRAGLAERFVHLAENVQTTFLGLRQRLLHDLDVKTFDLDIHLNGGNTVLCPGNLEVHVPEMIFGAQNVGQDRVLLAFLDEPHRNAGNRSLHRHAGIKQRQGTAAHRGHRRRSVRLEHF